ncbi:MAG: ATP-binding protein [Acidimicrobiales bacterium]
MRVSLMLCLPRDSSTLSVVRHIAAAALRELGVVTEEIDDVTLALTEAAANVVKHSGEGDQYEIQLILENTICEIRVVDTGHGFDASSLAVSMAAPSEEQGRGMALMAALVDSVRFESRPEEGTVVHLVKDLTLRPDGPLDRLVAQEPAATP